MFQQENHVYISVVTTVLCSHDTVIDSRIEMLVSIWNYPVDNPRVVMVIDTPEIHHLQRNFHKVGIPLMERLRDFFVCGEVAWFTFKLYPATYCLCVCLYIL